MRNDYNRTVLELSAATRRLAAEDGQQEACLRMLPATFVLKKCIIPHHLAEIIKTVRGHLWS